MVVQLVVMTSHLNSSNVPCHMLLKHCIRCSSVSGALGVFLQSGRWHHCLSDAKGPKNECSSYRPISLLSVPGKVFSHVLLERLQPLLQMTQRLQQSGFTATAVAPLSMLSWLCCYYQNLPTVQPSIICCICGY